MKMTLKDSIEEKPQSNGVTSNNGLNGWSAPGAAEFDFRSSSSSPVRAILILLVRPPITIDTTQAMS